MSQGNSGAARLAVLACLLVLAFSSLSIYNSYTVLKNTGSLSVASGDPNATLSVSQPNREARFIGVGKAEVKLRPGTYLVSASNNGRQSAKPATIALNQKTVLSIDPTSVRPLPTVDNLQFLGLSGLIANGLSDTQINLFKYYVFDYAPSASTVLIQNASITPGAHNPDVDTSFSLKFSFSIDDQEYRADINYSGLSDLHLVISSSGKTVYDSAKQG